MKNSIILIVASLLFLRSCNHKEEPERPPNIIYILADDLGYGETDIREEHDVSAEHPEIIAQIERIMKEQHVPSANKKFKLPQLGDD